MRVFFCKPVIHFSVNDKSVFAYPMVLDSISHGVIHGNCIKITLIQSIAKNFCQTDNYSGVPLISNRIIY